MNNRHSEIAAWVMILVFLALWELGVRMLQIPPYLLPAPSVVLQTLIANPAVYARATFITVGEALTGLFLGVLAGAVLAAFLTLFPGLENGVMTLAILVKSTPLVAVAPLLTLWLGFGVLPKIIITGLLTFFPVLVNILSGLHQIDPALMDLFQSWRANRWEIFWHLRLPSALPYLFAALKISTPLALIGAVVAEWTGASGGLGKTMWMAYTNLNLPFLFAAILILAVIGAFLYRFLVWIEKRTVFWVQPLQE